MIETGCCPGCGKGKHIGGTPQWPKYDCGSYGSGRHFRKGRTCWLRGLQKQSMALDIRLQQRDEEANKKENEA